jgi:diguanylate cyclase (GGDEF)-like protein
MHGLVFARGRGVMRYAAALLARMPMLSLVNVVLTVEPVQRTRLVQAAVVLVAAVLAALVLLLLMAAGVAPTGPVLLWALVLPGGMLAIYLAVRSGWSRRCADPALTLPQLLLGGAGCAFAYALGAPARSVGLMMLMVLLMGAMMTATPRQMARGSLFAVTALGAAMFWTGSRQTGWPAIEVAHFLLVVTLVPAASLLSARLATMRARGERQQELLEAALARIRELATRDELTALPNRREMSELMTQEYQRSIRSGRTFCLAVLDIDGFKALNESHGREAGDAVLRNMAGESIRRVRVSDVFGRWGGDRFVLLLRDASGPLAKTGVERVRTGLCGVRLPGPDLRITLSAGLAEHHAGETAEDTLDRAERALAEARRQGGDRMVVDGGPNVASSPGCWCAGRLGS